MRFTDDKYDERIYVNNNQCGIAGRRRKTQLSDTLRNRLLRHDEEVYELFACLSMYGINMLCKWILNVFNSSPLIKDIEVTLIGSLLKRFFFYIIDRHNCYRRVRLKRIINFHLCYTVINVSILTHSNHDRPDVLRASG